MRNEFLATFGLVSRRLKKHADRRLARHGVHAGQQFILECLSKKDGLTMGELAKLTEVEAPTISRAVQRMTTSGLVRGEPDDRDSRRIRIWLTMTGHRACFTVPKVMDQYEDEVLSDLDPAERAALIDMLSRIRRRLDLLSPP
jgi:MarR family transcriptional regulator, organic hydroperoxide resistance regulator